MKKLTLSILLTAVALVSVIAQDLPVNDKTKYNGTCDQPICVQAIESRPLVIVDGIETDLQCLALNPERIEKISILKGKSVKEYASRGIFAVILITTKPGTEFYTISDFINPEKNLNKSVGKVQIDGELLTDMNKILIDKSVFKQTMISSEYKTDLQNGKFSVDDTLVVMTTLKEHKE